MSRPAARLILICLALLIAAAGAFWALSGDSSDNQSTPAAETMQSATETEQSTPETEQEISTLSERRKDVLHKNNLSRLAGAINEYISNNNGRVPNLTDVATTVIHEHLGGEFYLPDTTTPYELVATDPRAGQVQYVSSAVCNPDGSLAAGGNRQVALRVQITGGDIYCAAN